MPHAKKFVSFEITRTTSTLLTPYPELRAISIVRYVHVNFDVIRCAPPLELSLDFDHIFDSASLVIFDTGLDPNEWFDRGG